MPKFEVHITQYHTASYVVEVSAKSKESAIKKAKKTPRGEWMDNGGDRVDELTEYIPAQIRQHPDGERYNYMSDWIVYNHKGEHK